MAQANLSEILFKPSFKHRETSTLIRRASHARSATMHSPLEGDTANNWYRMLNRLLWAWRGVDAVEIVEVLSRIAASAAEHSDERLLDTVVGYRNGNWIYEWVHQGMQWQQRALEQQDPLLAGKHWLRAANFYSIAGYPHLKGDELAEQAEVLANRAYEEAALLLPYQLKELEFKIDGGSPITGFLHMPEQGKAPFPTVLMCGSLDTLQTDYHRLFNDYLAPLGIAMLTIDMPSIGASAKWKLTQDSSFLHQQVLSQLPGVPWIDHQRVTAFGFRFGANVAVRLAYLEPQRLRGVACLGPVVHGVLCDARNQQQVPDMYMDVLASRMGMADASDHVLKMELNRYSLKMQGLLGRRCYTPMLSGFWEQDPLSSKAESQLIASSSLDGKLLAIPRAPIYRSFHQALQQMSRWLHDKMR
ncbi:esterase FrsA [Serratia rubidaea]|uniref:esterase FrsA n=1 Tax=Serratia rubidaea TaxID=61652 RepID=UPI002349C069|nr:esterase FrsA [Serratia rubidaea]MDC6120458.1 esterase FrsA [Serratia rubidaea]HDJ1438552.1 esterase FrsA [Serratia rubidaea]HDJ1447734.1 esterase FrsA [Serratia rubidaea]HDJ1462741.1 esterase FrsA [Serratia rubidaea]HDJ2772598.1 esterase FrsA [Serratia rubidaea]